MNRRLLFFKQNGFLLSSKALNPTYEIRNKLLSWMLILLNALALPTIILAAVEAFQIGLPGTAVFYIIFSFPIIGALLLQKKIPYLYTVLLFLLSGYAIGVYNLIDYGFSGAAIPIFCFIAVLSTIFLGIFAGIMTLIANSIPMIIIAYLMSHQLMSIEIDLMKISHNPVSWVTSIIVMLFLGGLMVFGYGVIQNSLIHSVEVNKNQAQELKKVNKKLKKDLTHRMKTEKNLERALVKATESDRLKSTFLATMSHELRTPLNAIIGFSEIIDEETPSKDILTYTQTIHNSGTHLLNIIDDLLDISLIESGESQAHFKEVNLHSILMEVLKIIEIAQQDLNKSSIDLKLIASSNNLEFKFITDPNKLKQILLNLLKNALKFTHKGFVYFGYDLVSQKGKSELLFYVSDSGIGIPKSKQKLIFKEFRHLEESRTKQYGGTGIGLSVANKLTNLLGGKIWVESEEGKGSKFCFTVPLKRNSIPL